MAEGMSSRWEDVFQDEITNKIPHDSFKAFARSSAGLGLSDETVDEIMSDYPRTNEWKMKLLFKWKAMNPEATFDTIRSKANKFMAPDINEEFSDAESHPLTDSIRVYPNRTIGSRDWILEGKMKMVTGFRKLAIKLLRWDRETEHEAEILLCLESHQNVISFIHSGPTKQGFIKYLYIAMELCFRKNLFEYVATAEVPFHYPSAYDYARQLVNGLKHIHSKGIRHRDLKPHNILLSLDLEYVKIADFGLSKIVHNERSTTTTNSKSHIGTNGYRAPESYNHNTYTKDGDIYSLGLVIHFLWSHGKHPFGEDPDLWNANIKNNTNRNFTHLRVPHKGSAKTLLGKMLQFQPKDRISLREILRSWNFREEDVNEDGEAIEELRQRKERILIFMKTSQQFPLSLCSLDPAAQTDLYDDGVILEKIVDVTEWGNDAFSAVACGDRVYVLSWIGYLFECHPLDPNPSWKRINDATKVLHGRWPSAVVVGDQMYICGGGFDEKGSCTRQNSLRNNENVVLNFSPAVKTCEVYNAAIDEWSYMKQMIEGRRHHSAVVVEGQIYIIGGRNAQNEVLGSTEIYDPQANEWTEHRAVLNTARYKGGAAVFEGKIYLHGGLNNVHATLSDVECFDTETGIWTIFSDMFVPRSLFRVCVCDSKLFAVAGDAYPGSGLGEFPARMSIGMYDPSKEEGWKKIKALSGMSLESSATLVFRI